MLFVLFKVHKAACKLESPQILDKDQHLICTCSLDHETHASSVGSCISYCIVCIARNILNLRIERPQCVQSGPPSHPPPCHFLCSCSALLTAPLYSLEVPRHCLQVLIYFCQAGAAAAAAVLLLRALTGHHLIQDRLQDCIFIRCAHNYPKAGLMCRKCPLMQETPATKTCLQYLHSILCWCYLSSSSMILT